MHEASLVAGMLDLVLEALNSYNEEHPEKSASKIREIICGIGLLGCVEANTLRACFELYAENTPAENALLSIHTIPLDCVCKDCATRFQLTEKRFICPACGSPEINFRGGNGMIIEAINCEEENG